MTRTELIRRRREMYRRIRATVADRRLAVTILTTEVLAGPPAEAEAEQETQPTAA
jgi:hypothetical protein